VSAHQGETTGFALQVTEAEGVPKA
jgi:hypothetical protein